MLPCHNDSIYTGGLFGIVKEHSVTLAQRHKGSKGGTLLPPIRIDPRE